MKSARILVALLLMGLGGWLVGSDSDYRPTSINLWLALSIAIASLGVLNAWRSAIPSGSSRGPVALLAVSLTIAGAVLWHSEAWVPPTAVLLVGVVALALGLHGAGEDTSQYRPFRALAWVPGPRRWEGALPVVTKVTVVLGSAKLDLRTAELAGSTDLNVSLLLGRLEVQVPADWPLRLHPPAGFGLRLEGQTGPSSVGPPLNLRILGVAGVVALRRVN
jgi:hypothetical protein